MANLRRGLTPAFRSRPTAAADAERFVRHHRLSADIQPVVLRKLPSSRTVQFTRKAPARRSALPARADSAGGAGGRSSQRNAPYSKH